MQTLQSRGQARGGGSGRTSDQGLGAAGTAGGQAVTTRELGPEEGQPGPGR